MVKNGSPAGDVRPGPGGYCDNHAKSQNQNNSSQADAQARSPAEICAETLVPPNPDPRCGFPATEQRDGREKQPPNGVGHSLVVDRDHTRTVSTFGLTRPELERLSGAIHFMKLRRVRWDWKLSFCGGDTVGRSASLLP